MLYPQLDGEAIGNFVNQFASTICYWKAIQCPCYNSSSGQPNIACYQCRGLGWFHNNKELGPLYEKAQVTSRKSQRMNEKGGLMTTGYASVTFLPGVIPGEGDLVQVCADREIVNDEEQVVGAKLTDGSTAESLRFRDIVCVEFVAMQNAVDKSVFKLDSSAWNFNAAERRVEFVETYPPGTKYSVRYLAVPEYIVKGETSKPLLRVTHDDSAKEPGRYTQDVVMPFNCQCVRLDRAILQRQRGAVDYTTQSTFNNAQGKGPFR